jgi:hypothetical protein
LSQTLQDWFFRPSILVQVHDLAGEERQGHAGDSIVFATGELDGRVIIAGGHHGSKNRVFFFFFVGQLVYVGDGGIFGHVTDFPSKQTGDWMESIFCYMLANSGGSSLNFGTLRSILPGRE